MRKALLCFAVIALMMTVAVPMFDITDSNGDTGTVSFDGYIKINGKLVTNENVVVTIIAHYYEEGKEMYGHKTNVGGIESGYFIVDGVKSGLSASSYYIRVSVNGYAVSGVSQYIKGTPDIIYGLEKAYNFQSLPSLVDNTYTVSSSDAQCINLSSSNGTVTGKIQSNDSTPVDINGAKISVINDSGTIVKSAYSSSHGNYTLADVPVGTYEITVEMSGYDTLTDVITITVDPIVVNYSLNQSKGEWFGFDFPHMLAVVAGIIGVVIIIFAVWYRVTLKKRKKIIYDDEEQS